MTLGELKKDLRKHGIRVVGSLLRRQLDGNTVPDKAITFFSADEKIIFPYKPKSRVHTLITNTLSDSEEVHPEKAKALKRSLIPDWDEE